MTDVPPLTRNRSASNLDFTRLALATSVIASHAYLVRFRDGTPGPDPLERATGLITFSIGSLAVNGFFVLSGYLIAGSYLRSDSLRDYLAKRVLRIYPGFIVAFVVTVTLFAWLTYGTLKTGHSVGEFMLRALTLKQPGVATAFHSQLLNGSMWSIRPEFACYLLIAAIGLSGMLRSRVGVSFFAIVIWACFFLSSQNPQFLAQRSPTLSQMPRLLTYFMLGTCAFLWEDRLRFQAIAAVVLMPVIAVSCFHPLLRVVTLPPALAYVLLTFGTSSTPGIRHAAKWGDFSYGLYLYAHPVQQCMIMRWTQLPIWLDAIVVFFVTVPFAVASWCFVERPALRWKAKMRLTSSPHIAEIVDIRPEATDQS